MGEVAVFAQVLAHAGILKAIAEQVRFARARFGQYDLIDFVAVLIGYVISGEPILQAFYERLATAFFARGEWHDAIAVGGQTLCRSLDHHEGNTTHGAGRTGCASS